ncbi:hypothetical protein [Francisella sp. TX07-6608]|nr:hypothetical protein [Francisella sp. TX07-6608]
MNDDYINVGLAYKLIKKQFPEYSQLDRLCFLTPYGLLVNGF